MSIEILIGDVRARLAQLPADHFDCVVTSPPYWGLRDYDVAGQIGLEPTLGEHLAVMVDVFREIRRVLKPSGTVWLNYGDCYATSPNGRSAADTKAMGEDDRTFRDKPFSTTGPVLAQSGHDGVRAGGGKEGYRPGNPNRVVAGGFLKPKDLCMVPNRLAIALQDDGWWVRSEIVWGKPNPMPESITDRPGTAHEKIFMLTKAARYFYDAEAVRMSAAPGSETRWAQDIEAQAGSERAHAGKRSNGPMKAVGGRKQAAIAAERWEEAGRKRGVPPLHAQYEGSDRAGLDDVGRGSGRNLRNYEPAPLDVWPMATRPFKDAHFATFPPELAERAIKAGCPAQCCAACGAPMVRQIERGLAPTPKAVRLQVVDERDNDADANDQGSNRAKDGHMPGYIGANITLGFAPSCACAAAFVPGRVLDPFGGAGTTGLVADRLRVDCTLIELNEGYAEIARRRIKDEGGMLVDVRKVEADAPAA